MADIDIQSIPISTDIPSKAIYRLDESNKAALQERVLKRFPASMSSGTTATTNGSDTVEYNINPQNYSLDPLESYFSGKMVTGNDAARLKGSIKRIFGTLIIENQGGIELERIERLPLIEDMLFKCCVPRDWFTKQGSLEGYADTSLSMDDGKLQAAITNTAGNNTYASFADSSVAPLFFESATYKAWMATGTPRYYTWHFHSSGILSNPKYLHLHQIGGLKIKLIMSSKSLASTTGDYSFTLSDSWFHASLVKFSENVNRAIQEAAQKGTLMLTYDTYNSNTYNVATAGDNYVEVKIAKTNVKACYVAKRVAAFDSDTKDSYATTYTDFNGYQFQLGSQFFPDRLVTEPAVAVQELLRSFNRHNDIHTATISYNDWVDTANALVPKHYLGCDFESDANSYNTGINTRKGNYITLNYRLSNATAYNLTAFVLFTRVVKIMDNQNLYIYD